MTANPQQVAISLLKNNWRSGSTDYETPHIVDITAQKKIEWGLNKDWILMHRSRPLQEPAGIGTKGKHVTEQFDVDIRTFGEDEEGHWRRIITEVDRIFDSKIINPSGSYNILDPDGQREDKSDKMHAIYRFLIPIKLIKYNKQR